MNTSVAIQVLPTTLDEDEVIRIVDEVIDYIKKHSEGRTVICVTHEPEDAKRLGGRTIEMVPVHSQAKTGDQGQGMEKLSQ